MPKHLSFSLKGLSFCATPSPRGIHKKIENEKTTPQGWLFDHEGLYNQENRLGRNA
jgi:hypothetical protein